jgi:hypothetical protein
MLSGFNECFFLIKKWMEARLQHLPFLARATSGLVHSQNIDDDYKRSKNVPHHQKIKKINHNYQHPRCWAMAL